MGSSAQVLPPKMAAHFAQLAKDGKADRRCGSDGQIYEFDQKGSTNVVVLISLNPPDGYIKKGSGI